MRKKLLSTILASSFLLASAKATIVTFTGGIATTSGGSTQITNNNPPISNVVSYSEGSFLLTYNVSPGGNYGAQTVGNYYGNGDVIHAHWTGGLESIEVTRTNNAAYDLQYFSLTSNTEFGGGPASGNEHIYIQGYYQGATVTPQFMLPGEDWGGSYQDIILPSSFDLVDMVRISGSGAFCYGMDNFVFDEPIPAALLSGNGSGLIPTAPVPEPTAAVLGSLGLALLLRRKRN